MVSVSKFVCFAAVCVFNSGGGLWWLERARSLEVACTRPLSWRLYFYMYFACFCSVKNYKKYNPGKSREIAKNTPRIAGNPREFFFDLNHSEVQRVFFPFRTSVSVKWPWRRERPLRLCLWALQLRGRRPQLKHLQKPLVCPKERKIEPRALKPTLVTQKNLRYVRSFVLKKG